MKSKLVILSLMLAGAASTISAQTKEKYVSESWKDNFFVSVGVGGQVCVNPDNSDYGLGHAITPNLAISFGKLFTPTWGVRAQVAGFWSTLYSEYASPVAGQYVEFKNKKFGTVRFDALYNVSNAIWGYNPDRLFNLSVFAGPGLTFSKTYGKQEDLNALVNGSVGLQGAFNINQNWDINIEARGEVSPSIFGSKSSAHTDGAVSMLAGATYYFGGKKFVPYVAKVNQDAINDELNRYRAELAQAQQELTDSKNAYVAPAAPAQEVVKLVETAGVRAIFFNLGSAKIDDYGKVNIQLAAKSIKANTDKKYKIAGYCDKATGSSSFNQKLSEKRAQAVYDALVAEGVDKDQLELVGFGGTENMFGKNHLNRCVIIE